MLPEDDPAERSTCTTCTFTDDFSNYWTASMYFRSRNHTYRRVKQLGALWHEDARGGGMTIYYVPHNGGSDTKNIVTFPKGFRMRNGDPEVKSAEQASRYQGIDYTCMLRESTRYTNRSTTFPKVPCPAGILTTIYFPQCWDGKNLDSPDHYSHVAWSINDKRCPDTHPVKIPQVSIPPLFVFSKKKKKEIVG